MRLFTLIILVFICSECLAQGYIGDSKATARTSFKKYKKQNDSLKVNILETDTTLTLSVNAEARNYSMDVTLHFDANGKCDSETHISGCDSCFQKYFTDVVNNEKYGWVKTGPGEYVSKFSKDRHLKTDPEKPFTYIITRTRFTRKEYNALLQEISR